ncbi:MAG TPA: carboxypeptidase-like regulatory domain-containing protein [Polyangiaceae bacterium]|nr:carboxypeptidase-like regulatory domain-containing protein [Polyangiaceae bacterium]
MSPVRSLIAFCLLAALPIGLARAADPAASATAARSKPAPASNGHETPQARATDEASGPAAPAPTPHAGMANVDPRVDVNEASPGLPPGTISATIVTDQGMPLAGQQVRLGIMFQKIAEGESRSEKFAQTDAQGSATFTGLTFGSDHAYRVTVQSGTANYQTAPFNLKPDMGQRVVLRVIPATSDTERAAFGMRGYLYVETRDDVFQFEAMFRVFNVGQITWVPNDVVIKLPPGFKAFKAQEGMTDVRFEQVEGVGARLKGTFPPGQSEASFRFQLPKSNDDSLIFRMSVPPHVAEMRVIAEASSTMNLAVDDFQPPVVTANQNGQRVLVSVKQLRERNEELKEFTATISGIPTPGPGRWYALALAGCMAIGGVFAARGAFDDAAGGKDVAADKKRARELLLRELVALENARREERIGPRSYKQSRLALIDAIARLGFPNSPPAARKKAKIMTLRKRPKSAAQKG